MLFEPARRHLRSDPDDNPYVTARSFTYRAAWTAPLFRALSFVIRVMCVDTEEELHEASAELFGDAAGRAGAGQAIGADTARTSGARSAAGRR